MPVRKSRKSCKAAAKPKRQASPYALHVKKVAKAIGAHPCLMHIAAKTWCKTTHKPVAGWADMAASLACQLKSKAACKPGKAVPGKKSCRASSKKRRSSKKACRKSCA